MDGVEAEHMAIENDRKRVDQPAPWSMKMAAPRHLRVREGERVMKLVGAIQREYCETSGNAKTARDSKTNFLDAELVLPEILVAEWQEQDDPC